MFQKTGFRCCSKTQLETTPPKPLRLTLTSFIFPIFQLFFRPFFRPDVGLQGRLAPARDFPLGASRLCPEGVLIANDQFSITNFQF
jgi:hypothetical protein